MFHGELQYTINTHEGMYTYKRSPYGVASAPAIHEVPTAGHSQGHLLH